MHRFSAIFGFASLLTTVALAGTLLVTAPADASQLKLMASGTNTDTYGTWSTSQPVKLAFDLAGITDIVSVTLTLWAYDVDTAAGERDTLAFNGFPVGFLTGKDNEAIANTISVGVSQLIANAVNSVQIYNPMNDTESAFGFLVYNSIDPLTRTDRRAYLTIETKGVPAPTAGAGLPLVLGLTACLEWHRRRKRHRPL